MVIFLAQAHTHSAGSRGAVTWHGSGDLSGKGRGGQGRVQRTRGPGSPVFHPIIPFFLAGWGQLPGGVVSCGCGPPEDTECLPAGLLLVGGSSSGKAAPGGQGSWRGQSRGGFGLLQPCQGRVHGAWLPLLGGGESPQEPSSQSLELRCRIGGHLLRPKRDGWGQLLSRLPLFGILFLWLFRHCVVTGACCV